MQDLYEGFSFIYRISYIQENPVYKEYTGFIYRIEKNIIAFKLLDTKEKEGIKTYKYR